MNFPPTIKIHTKETLTAPASAWTPSLIEEIISALWFICAFTSLGAGCPMWVFVLFFSKACLDLWDAIRYARKEAKEERDAEKPPLTTE